MLNKSFSSPGEAQHALDLAVAQGWLQRVRDKRGVMTLTVTEAGEALALTHGFTANDNPARVMVWLAQRALEAGEDRR